MSSKGKMPPAESWHPLVSAALSEDLGTGDVTSAALIPADASGEARLEAREDLVVAGLEVAREVFSRLGARFETRVEDGHGARQDEVLATVRGPARAILSGERTALNFLQRLSGVASLTRSFCDAVAGTRAAIIDTRKTTPGWRRLEKFAVRCGGGANHRIGLWDGILIKDNHIAAVGGVQAAVERAKAHNPGGLPLQVEVESLEDVRAAVDAGAESLLIDNQPPAKLAEFVSLARRLDSAIVLEASGGVTLARVRAIAETGVDRISIGALTHSARAMDLALEWNPEQTI